MEDEWGNEEENRRVECDNCDWTGTENDLEDGLAGVSDLFERLDVGSEVPAGECPECGAFVYLAEKDNPYWQKGGD